MRSFGEIHEYKEPPLHHQTDQYSRNSKNVFNSCFKLQAVKIMLHESHTF